MAVSVACGPAPRSVEPIEERIDTLLAPLVDSRNFGGTVLVERDGETLVHRGWGLASREHYVPNGPRTRFQLGSISKSFTAAAVLVLRDRGALALDDPVTRFLPSIQPWADVTIHDLLVHTSGLPRYVFRTDFLERSSRSHSPASLVEWIQDEPLQFAPGERSAYSNANYAVLARVIELAAGRSFEQFVNDDVLARTGLSSVGHRGDPWAVIPHLAHGYTPVGVDALAHGRHLDYTTFTGSGSLYATAADLANWIAVLRAGALLSDDSRDRMFQAHAERRGYGWMIEQWRGRDVIRMDGWDGVGFSTAVWHMPADDLTVVVLSNVNISSLPTRIASDVSALTLQLEPDAVRLHAASAPIDLAGVSGRFRFGSDFFVPGAVVEVTPAKRTLELRWETGGAVEHLLPLAGGGFVHRQQWMDVSFERDVAGRRSALRYGPFVAGRIDEP